MAKQGNAWKFSKLICINFLLIFVLTNQNEATLDPAESRKTQEYIIGDELERLELNLYTSETNYSFQLSKGPFRFCEEANENSEVVCHPKISLSLLKMQCDNSTTVSSMMLSSPDGDAERPICRNYTYLYSDMYEAMHKNLKEFKNITTGFEIFTKGNWSPEGTHASILVSIHYELFNREKCPSKQYFDCSDNCKHNTVDDAGKLGDNDQMYNPNSSICIPIDWICDKKPNCGLCGDADESQSLCLWAEEPVMAPSVQYAVVVLSLVVSFVLTPVLILIVLRRTSVFLCKEIGRPEVPYPATRSSNTSTITIADDEEERPQGRTNRSFSKDSWELPPSYLEVVTSTNPDVPSRPANTS